MENIRTTLIQSKRILLQRTGIERELAFGEVLVIAFTAKELRKFYFPQALRWAREREDWEMVGMHISFMLSHIRRIRKNY